MLDGCTPWPEQTAERYRAEGLWRGLTLDRLLRSWAERSGERTALVHGEHRLSYAELDRRVERLAARFRALGLRAGDRAVVQLPNRPEFLLVCFALFRLDAKPVFALTAHRRREIEHLCRQTEAACYVVAAGGGGFRHTDLAVEVLESCDTLRAVAVVGEVPAEAAASRFGERFHSLEVIGAETAPSPEPPAPLSEPLSEPDAADVAFFLLSGGTTALPKLIPRTHEDYACQIRLTAELDELGPRDVYLAALPLEFNFTWGCPGVLGTLHAGGLVVIADDADPADCFDLIDREGVTVTALVPSIAQLWIDAAHAEGWRGESLRLVQIGGAPLAQSVAARVGPVIGGRLQQVFGMAEGLLSFTRADDPEDVVTGTQGRPISASDELRVVDEQDRPVAAGEVGELLVRGPYTLRGYYRADEHNARAFTADGFYRTGDLARLTGRGDLVIAGRLKDVVIRGGAKVSAPELEAVLLEHPRVARAAVVPVPDTLLGEGICVFVQPRGEAPKLRELRDFLREQGLADFKLPDRLETVAALPLTGLGKVDKKLLAKIVAQDGAESDHPSCVTGH